MEPFDIFIWKRIFVQIGGVIAIALVLGGFLVVYSATYNSVSNLDRQADAGWAGITRDMQERYGGIPGLADDLRPSLGSDASSLDEVARNMSRLRTALDEGDMGTINPATTNLEASLSLLTGVLKEHPEFGSSPEVRDFLATLEASEGRISDDQSNFNEGIQSYNQAISSFPASLWTYNWGFSRREYFTARIGTREPPSLPVEETGTYSFDPSGIR